MAKWDVKARWPAITPEKKVPTQEAWVLRDGKNKVCKWYRSQPRDLRLLNVGRLSQIPEMHCQVNQDPLEYRIRGSWGPSTLFTYKRE